MKKRLLSFVLAGVMMCSVMPTTHATDFAIPASGFLLPVAEELPEKQGSGLMDGDVELPDVKDAGFLGELSDDMPEIRADGFLKKPTQPLKTFPEKGKLLAAVFAPDETAIEISTAEELATMTSDGNYVLTQNIDLSESVWTPLPSASNLTLDGQGYTISGMHFVENTSYAALFQSLNDSTVRNVIFADPVLKSTYRYANAAAIAANASGDLTIENCSVEDAKLVSGKACGGLVGAYSDKSGTLEITDCAVAFSTEAELSYDTTLGGLVGTVAANTAQFTDCLVQATCAGDTGGLAYSVETASSFSMLRCSVTGKLSDSTAAGMVYQVRGTCRATDCVFDGILEKGGAGFIKTISGAGIFENCRASGTLYNAQSAFVGTANSDISFLDCLADMDNTIDASNLSYIGGLLGSGSGSFYAENCLNTGDFTQTGDHSAYIGGLLGSIASPAATQLLRCENQGSIDAKFYAGGMVANGRTANELFRFTDCRNAGSLSGVTVGGLLADGSIIARNCVNTGELYGTTVGGMVAKSSTYSVITDCRANGTITLNRVSTGYGGGMVGQMTDGQDSEYTGCAANVTFILLTNGSSTPVHVGGLAGEGSGEAVVCNSKVRFEGNVLSAANIGGLFGSATKQLEITDSAADIKLKEITFQGAASLGGLVGLASCPVTVENCAAEFQAAVPTSVPGSAGGIVGRCNGNTVIRQTYATGTIDMEAAHYGQAQGYAGGLIGRLENRYSHGDAISSHLMEIKGCWADVDIYDAQSMGGLVGYCHTRYASVSSSWADSKLSLKKTFALPSDDIIFAEHMGGLVGCNVCADAMTNENKSLYMQDCYFDGELEYANAEYVGGVVGEGAKLVYNCYSTADIISMGKNIDGSLRREGNVGGLVGMCTDHYYDLENSTTPGIVSYCYYSGKIVTYIDYSGGIVGHGFASHCVSTATMDGMIAGGIVGRGQAFNCQFDGTVHGCSYGGGIVGTGYAEDCVASGTISGNTIGSISGSATYYYFPATISNCTGDCLLRPCGHQSGNHTIGGIVGGGGDAEIINCHYERALTLDATALPNLTFGGIVGAGGTLCQNSSSKGIVINDLFTQEIAAGGISGFNFDGTIENCWVDGSVQLIGQGGGVYAGGLVGYTENHIYLANCVVNGNVITSIQPLHEGGGATVDCGTMVGHCRFRTVTLENCRHNGRFSQGTQYYGDDDYWENLPECGDGRKEYAHVPVPTRPEKPVEDYLVSVKALKANGTLIPLPDVAVYANGTCVGISDAMGEVCFDSETFTSNTPVRLSAGAEGYFECVANTFLADGGTFTLVLKEKVPGEIYFRSAVMTGADTGVSDLLSGVTSLRISMLDENLYPLTIEVDWNDLDETPRSLMLTNESFTHTIGLDSDGGTTYVRLPKTFDVNEKIYLRAVGVKDGEAITKQQELSVQVHTMDVHFPTESGSMDVGGDGDKDNLDYLYFLKGLGIDLDFDDLEDFASGISYKNGCVTVKFSMQDEQKKEISVWDGFSENVSVGGEVTVPVSNISTGEWSGKVTASVNGGVKSDISNGAAKKYNKNAKEKDKITYDFLIAGVPCFLETSLDVGGSASFGVHGPFGDAYVDGDVTVKGGGGIFAGLGGEVVKEFEFKIGGEGELNATLPMKFDTANENAFSLDPELEGNVNAKVSVKAYILELEEKLRIGGFYWNKNGAEWTWFDEEPSYRSTPGVLTLADAFSAEVPNWTAMDRDYLNAGGGFLTQEISGYAFNGGSNQNLRYENIGALTETAMTVADDQIVLYYTADDGMGNGGDVTTHTVLYCTKQQADGSWSDPVAVSSTADGYPAAPDASGDYVIWVESTELGSLDDMLKSTRIRIAKDGEIVHTIDTDGYVYAPKIADYGGNVLVCWFNDPNVSSTNLMGGEPELYSAFFTNDAWGEPNKVSTIGTPLVASPLCGPSESYSTVYYITEDGDYCQAGKSTALVSGLAVGRTIMDHGIAAVFGEDGTLTIYLSNYGLSSHTVNYNGTVAPDMYFDQSTGAGVLAWPEDNGICVMTSSNSGFTWSDPILFPTLSGSTTELNTIILEEIPTITYTQTIKGLTHLYTAENDPDAADLVLVDMDYQESDMLERGSILFQGTVYNHGAADAAGFTLSVVDEDDVTLYTRTYNTAVTHGATANFSAAIGHDGLDTHTYTFRVEPLDAVDADDTDNAWDAVVGLPRAEIVDANFQQFPDGRVQLCAMVQNTGVVQLDGLTVEIASADGDTILSQTYQDQDAIPYASVRQLLLDNVQPNTYYCVSVLYEDEILDSTMLMYEDRSAQVLTATAVSVNGTDAQVTIYGQNQSTSGMVILGIYADEQMVAAGTDQVLTLNGKKTLEIPLSDVLEDGKYEYKVFFLSDDGRYIPLTSAVSGTVKVQ